MKLRGQKINLVITDEAKEMTDEELKECCNEVKKNE